MAEDKNKDQSFEVEELSDEGLEGVAGGVDADAELSSDAPGNNCTNNATGC